MLATISKHAWAVAAVLVLGLLSGKNASAALAIYGDESKFQLAALEMGAVLATETFDGAAVDFLPAVQFPGFGMAISGPALQDQDLPPLPPYLASYDNPQYCLGTCITAGFLTAGTQLDLNFDAPVKAVSLLLGAGYGHSFKILIDDVPVGDFVAPSSPSADENGPPVFDFLGILTTEAFAKLSLRSDDPPAGEVDIENVSFDRPAPIPEPSSLTLLLAAIGLAAARLKLPGVPVFRSRRRRGQSRSGCR